MSTCRYKRAYKKNPKGLRNLIVKTYVRIHCTDCTHSSTCLGEKKINPIQFVNNNISKYRQTINVYQFFTHHYIFIKSKVL